MATTVTTTSGWGGLNSGFRLRMTVTRESVEVANNRSKVRSRVWVESRNGSSFTYNSVHVQSIDGANVYSGTIARSCPANGQILVLDNERWITHNADGSRSVQSIADFSNPVAGSMTVAATLVLDDIPRATTPEFSGNFTAGSAKSITLPRASSSFTHTVTYKIGSASGTISSSAGASVSWTPPLSLLSQIPNATSGSGTITVVTKSGSTTVGTKSKGFTLVASSSIIPTVSAVAWEDTNAAIRDTIGAFVQGLSTVKGTVTAAGIYGSSITSKRTKIGSSTVSAGTAVRVTGAGSVAASGEATDSRGRVGTRTANMTVLAYKAPTTTALSVDRAIANGDLSDTGTYLRMTLTAAVQSLIVSGSERNAAAIVVKTKTGDGAWVTRQTLSPGLSYNGSTLIDGGGIYLTAQSHEVRIEIRDVCGQLHVAETTVGTASVTLDLRGTNVGVGKYHEQGGLDVAGEVYARGALLCPPGVVMDYAGETEPPGWLFCDGRAIIRDSYPELFAAIGTTYGGGNGTTTFNLPDKRGRVSVGKSADSEFNTLGKTGGAKTHTLTTAQLPSHSHGVGGHGRFLTTNRPSDPGKRAAPATTTGDHVPAFNNVQDVGSEATTSSAGSSAAHNNIQPYLTLNTIIRY